jgi:DNA-binding GntR family transcriptional regulator
MNEARLTDGVRGSPADVAVLIETDIIFGHFAPGARLVEDQLMLRYKASRHFVREALADLEATGLVRRERHVGATVSAFGRDEILCIYEVREMLTRQAILMIELPADDALIASLAAAQAAYRAAIASGDRHAIHAGNDVFHLRLLEACGNPWLVRTIRDYMRLTLPVRARSLAAEEGLATSLREHDMMMDLLRGRDRWALAQLAIAHMQPSKMDYLGRFVADRPNADHVRKHRRTR